MPSSKGTSVQQFFPFTPDYMSWEDWNGNFILWYGQENIPAHPEDNWQAVANHIASNEAFASYPIPVADRYENWQDWAKDVTTIINGPAY
jgi:hypothetical protein